LNQVRRLRYHGQDKHCDYSSLGFNSQLHSIQAAIILEKLKHLNEWQSKRQTIALKYTQALQNVAYVSSPLTREHNEHIFHKYVLHIANDERDHVERQLNSVGIETKRQYETALLKHPCFETFETHGYMSSVERITQAIISLPLYPELTDIEVDFICQQLQKL